MSIRVHCPVCGYRIKAPDGSYGRRGVCPRCKLMIRLPTQAEAEAEGLEASAPPSAGLAGESGLGIVDPGSDSGLGGAERVPENDSALEFHAGPQGM